MDDTIDATDKDDKKARTEQWRAALRQIILGDLGYFHKQRWARIAAEIDEREQSAPDAKAKARAQDEMRAHYKTRFDPESSREALLAEVDTRELPPPGL